MQKNFQANASSCSLVASSLANFVIRIGEGLFAIELALSQSYSDESNICQNSARVMYVSAYSI